MNKNFYFGNKNHPGLFTLRGIKQATSQKKIPTNNKTGIPCIVQSTTSNMFSRLVDKDYVMEHNEPMFKGNVILLGVTLPAVSYNDVHSLAGSQLIEARADFLDHYIGLFICAYMKKYMELFSYTRKPGLNIYNDLKLSLPIQCKNGIPVIDNEKKYHKNGYIPDWNYMQERISELEQERISELEAYLIATGLDDYELTIEDEMALKGLFDEDVTFKSFAISDLFNSVSGDTDIKKEHINGKGISVVSSGIENRSIIGYTDIPAKIISKHSLTIDMFGNVFYRDEAYKMVTHARVFALIPKNFELDRCSGEFFEGVLSKLKEYYSYDNMCSFAKIKNIEVSLPVNPDGSINWVYICAYIRALEKTVIADVVRHKDKVIQTAKSIIK